MPVVTFVDPDSVHNPAANVAPASWFTTIEADFRSIVGRVACRIMSSTAQDLTDTGTTTITLGTVNWNNGMTTGAVANAITVPASYAGKYLVTYGCRLVSTTSAANYCSVDVQNNGAIVHREYARRSSASGSAYAAAGAFTIALAVGDDLTMTVEAFQMDDIDTDIVATYPFIAAVWLSV